MHEIIRELDRLRGRSRALLILQRVAILFAAAIGAVIVFGALDFLLRFPAAVRTAFLLIGVVALAWATWRSVVPALLFHPTLTDIALRVERVVPGLSGRLASSVEFAGAPAVATNPLAVRSMRDAETRAAGATLHDVVHPAKTRRNIAVACGVLAVATIFVVISPAGAETALRRILLPLGTAEWPARTGVASLMEHVSVHPRGQVIVLRAEGTRAPGGRTDQMTITAHYRLERDGRYGPWREATLTHQGRAVYERPVDTEADTIQFYFSSQDDRTPTQVVTLAPPPAIERATLTIVPPEYARPFLAETTLELGPGVDERSVSDTPALVGSTATVEFVFNKALPVPSDRIARERWVRQTFGWPRDQALPQLSVDSALSDRAAIRWEVAESLTLALRLVDEHGLENVEDIAYRIQASVDHPPSITITKPESDQNVLATAVVPIASEARDDVAVERIGVEARKQTNAEVPEPPVWQEWSDGGAATASIAEELNLASLALVAGDVVELTAVASDLFYLNGEEHEPARSPVRRLRIVGEREFGEALFHELKALRENAIRLEARQAELQDDVVADSVQPGVKRAQERIGERLAEQLDSLRRVRERVETNRFEDNQIEALINQSEDLLSHAGRASNEAVEAIDEREDNQPEEDEAEAEDRQTEDAERRQAREEDREVVEAQQEVREELRDLIEALDRNEDTWVMNQRIRDLMESQAELQAETEALSETTMGQSLDELEAAELSELDRIAQRQEELAQSMRDLVDELRDRASDMEEVDPQAADAQRQAADTAEQRETDRKMSRAAEQARSNQLQNARNSQQQARNDLEQMLNDLDQKRAQAEELQRRLESMIESIKRLVTMQEEEISALAEAVHQQNFAGRDRGMIRLNQNTQVVGAEARAAGRGAERIARALDRAADAQGDAIGALRQSPVAAEDARLAEERSLELLKEAQSLAEELEEEVEEDILRQRREDLMAAYTELREREVALRGDTLDLSEAGELDRRALVESRRLGNVQEEIATALEDVRATTQEISDSPVFSHVHSLIDGWAADVVGRLREGDLSVDTTDRQLSIANSLQRLVQALEEEIRQQEFEQGNAGGEGGDGGADGQGSQQPQPLLPPIAELKLLRELQELIYDETKALDARSDLEDASRRQRHRELSRRQQDLVDLGQQLLEALSPAQGGQPEPPTPPQGDEP